MELINNIMWYEFIFVAILFLVFGIDDLFLDFYYWSKRIFRRKQNKPLDYSKLMVMDEKKIALMIPVWHEYDVIGDMLQHNLKAINYISYDVFVGTYANDNQTRKEIENVREKYLNIHIVIADHDGPTSKADNLDTIYKHIVSLQQERNIKYEIIVMHDAEDVIHPLSFKLYNYFMPEYHMLQTPVLPLEISYKKLTHWTYCDQFAELHTKELCARSWLRGFIPSAGVGTAFTMNALSQLAAIQQEPFASNSVAEDYDAALRLYLTDPKEAFLLKKVNIVKKLRKRWFLFGKNVPVKRREVIATRSMFPTRYLNAIRQQSRWIYGVVMQEWKTVGWPGKFKMKYLLMHDRKIAIMFFIIGIGYFILAYWFFVYIWTIFNPGTANLSHFLHDVPLVFVLVMGCTILMLERALQRFIATSRVYGVLAGLLAIPRMIYANLINFHIILRVYKHLLFCSNLSGKVKWAKTQNSFPTEKQLARYKFRLKDIL